MTGLVNPYIVGNPITSNEMFFGREDDFRLISNKLGPGSMNRIVVLCGERRCGKTSILFQLRNGRLGAGYLPVLVDVQMLGNVRDDADFIAALTTAARDGIEETATGPPPARSVGPVDTWDNLVAVLSAASSRKPRRTLLFLIDEYEIIEEWIVSGRLTSESIRVLTAILESDYPVSFVFTGSQNIEDRDSTIWAPLFGKSVYRKVSYLSERDTARLVTEPVAGRVTYADGVVPAIYRITGGQPFYTQLICQNLIDLLIDEERGRCTAADMEHVIEDVVNNPPPQMVFFWNSQPAALKIILATLSMLLARADEWTDAQRTIASIRATRLRADIDREGVSSALEQASHSDILEKGGAGYRSRLDLFRVWIGREHSIWQVAKETGYRISKRSWRYIQPIGLGALGLAAVLLLWFYLIPVVAPGLASWGARVGLLPVVNPTGADVRTPVYIENVSLKSSRGPFTVVIDGIHTLHSADSALGDTWIVAPPLARGMHDFHATLPGGEIVDLTNWLVNEKRDTVFFSTFVAQNPDGSAAVAYDRPDDQGQADVLDMPFLEDRGKVLIESDPSGASVLSRNEIVGSTPMSLDLYPGRHFAWLLKDGYQAGILNFVVEEGKVTREFLTLEVGWSLLSFRFQEKATVYLDGEPLVELPTQRTPTVRSGKHQLTIINASGLTIYDTELTLSSGDTYDVTAD